MNENERVQWMKAVLDKQGPEGATELAAACEAAREARAIGESMAKPPRRWTEMTRTWSDLMAEFLRIVVASLPIFEGEDAALFLRAWRYMWALPPGSEARKAAFTLGEAAFWIDRWRLAWNRAASIPDEQLDREGVPAPDLGQRAEAALRILRWHLDDARGEKAVALGSKDVRLYRGEWDGVELTVIASDEQGWRGATDPVYTRMLEHHFEVQRAHMPRIWEALKTASWCRSRGTPDQEPYPALLAAIFRKRFMELAVASLPKGEPWTMTTRDIDRFVELILEAP